MSFIRTHSLHMLILVSCLVLLMIPPLMNRLYFIRISMGSISGNTLAFVHFCSLTRCVVLRYVCMQSVRPSSHFVLCFASDSLFLLVVLPSTCHFTNSNYLAIFGLLHLFVPCSFRYAYSMTNMFLEYAS